MMMLHTSELVPNLVATTVTNVCDCHIDYLQRELVVVSSICLYQFEPSESALLVFQHKTQ